MDNITQEIRENLDKIVFKNEREKHIIYYRFGLNDGVSHTLKETGKMFGVTTERIRQIEAKYIYQLHCIKDPNY